VEAHVEAIGSRDGRGAKQRPGRARGTQKQKLIGDPGMLGEPASEVHAIQPSRGMNGPAAPAQPEPIARAERASGVVIGLFLLAVLYTCYFARALLLPIVLAVLFTLLLSPVVRVLKRWWMPEPLGAGIVLLAVIGIAGAAVYTLVDPATEWIAKVPGSLRAVDGKLRQFKQPVADVRRAAERLEAMTGVDGPGRVTEVVVKREDLSSLLANRTPYFMAGVLSTVVLLYFLLASGDLFLRKVVRITPSMRNKIHAVEVGRSIQREIGRYFFTVSMINAGLGLATGAALHLLGMPNPLLWGVTVMLLNFIPYLGPLSSLLILTVAAILAFDDLSRAWMVPGVFLALTVIEGQFIQPVVVGRRLSLNPVMVFLAFLVLGWLWGIAGMFTAVPILVMLKVIGDHVERFAPLGEFLGRQ
jgi:predicted PurR-regulated permease PerM